MARTFGKFSNMAVSNKDINEAIRKKAYELYEKRGKKANQNINDWLEAEKIVKADLSK